MLECRNLSKRYGRTTALDQVSLSLPAGEPIALIGPNGAGKTTLISLISGFIHCSSGSLSVLGHPPGSATLHGQLAVLPQDALLDPRVSIGHQLRLFARLQGLPVSQAASEVQRVLQLVDLPGTQDSRPGELSHGMRKRIAIAQALLGSPRLVLLDEPTAGIDPPNARLIRELIRQQSPDITFIVSSHNLDELEKLCRTVVSLEKGRLLSIGPVADDSNSTQVTLRLQDVPADDFLSAVRSLSCIQQVIARGAGEFLLVSDDDMQASVALMQLLVARGWKYRQVVRGQTLEERLYGHEPLVN